MGRKGRVAAIAGALTLHCAGCAGPGGPAFGLGAALAPEWDQLTGLLLFACAGVGLYWLLRRSPLFEKARSTPQSLPQSASMVEAERIVRQRYARGEIGREEYLAKIDDLRERSA